jgi:quercetin dioxygenase-like cupin family protein
MFKYSEIEAINCEPGVKRRVLSHGGSIMNTEVSFEKNACGNRHSHIHEQTSYVVSGKFRYDLGDSSYILEKGDSIYIPSGVEHGCEALEENSVLLDSFTPQRDEWL